MSDHLKTRPDPYDMFVGISLSTFAAVMQLLVERKHQDAKYPHFAASYAEMSLVMLQEVGELADELGRMTWPGTSATTCNIAMIRQAAIDEAIDVAAVAIRIVEHLTDEGE